jgi:hypothetical protein
MKMPQHKGCKPPNKGKKMCDLCRKHFPKRELKISRYGQFCRDCYQKRTGGKETALVTHEEMDQGYTQEDVDLAINKNKPILNPNCSEVVCRLDVKTVDEAKKQLKRIGINVVGQMDWYMNFDDEPIKDFIIDTDNPNSPDFANQAQIALVEDFEGEGIFIVEHQDSQHQTYPTLKKIEDGLRVEFYGYDGGYNFEEYYKGWKEKGTRLPDYQVRTRKWIGVLLNNQQFAKEVDQLFERIDYLAPRYKIKNVKPLSEFTQETMKNKVNDYKKRMAELNESAKAKGESYSWEITPSQKRSRYMTLEALMRKELMGHLEEIAAEGIKGIEESWMGQLPGLKKEELTEERKQELYNYSIGRLATALYIIMSNDSIIRDTFFNKKWEPKKEKEEMLLNPNCSEATVRMDITDLPSAAVKKILDALEEIKNEHGGAEDGRKIADDDAWWYDSWFGVEQVFKVTTIKISGDVPYNSFDKLVVELERKLKDEVITEVETVEIETASYNTRVEILTDKGKKTNGTKTTKTKIYLSEVLETLDYSD